jgi:hypothetical protein
MRPNLVMGPEIKNDRADEGQQQIIQPINLASSS